MTSLPEADCKFIVVPRVRGQQLKDQSQLDGWLRDGSAALLFVSLGIVLASLTAGIRCPKGIPGALAALAVGWTIHLVGERTGVLAAAPHAALADPSAGLWPTAWLSSLRLEWLEAWPDTVRYLPIVIPFALGTVVGGIDCTESAAAADCRALAMGGSPPSKGATSPRRRLRTVHPPIPDQVRPLELPEVSVRRELRDAAYRGPERDVAQRRLERCHALVLVLERR